MNAYREISLPRHRQLRSFSYVLRRFPIDRVPYETRAGLEVLAIVAVVGAVYRRVADSDGWCWCPWRPQRNTVELDVSTQTRERGLVEWKCTPISRITLCSMQAFVDRSTRVFWAF